jgi:hypothetical protein
MLSNIININKLNKEITKLLPPSIQTKIGNISGKAQDDSSIPCTTKRVSKDSRLYIPYYVVKKNNLTIEQLDTHNNGICVGLSYRSLVNFERNQEELGELEKYLINNIGSDNNVSSIVTIINDGDYSGESGSDHLRKELNEFEKIIKDKHLTPVVRKEIKTKNYNHNNDKWEGHYYYCIKGGDQETKQSWVGSEPQLFTTFKNFLTNKQVIDDTKACLLYQFLHLRDINEYIDNDKVINYKNQYKIYLGQAYYQNKSCLDLIHEIPYILNKEGYLNSPILCKELSIKNFCAVKEVDISHNEAVNKHKIYYDETNKIMLSDFRPGNLFWDLHLGNMRQQDDTVSEYWISIEEANKRRLEI